MKLAKLSLVVAFIVFGNLAMANEVQNADVVTLEENQGIFVDLLFDNLVGCSSPETQEQLANIYTLADKVYAIGQGLSSLPSYLVPVYEDLVDSLNYLESIKRGFGALGHGVSVLGTGITNLREGATRLGEGVSAVKESIRSVGESFYGCYDSGREAVNTLSELASYIKSWL